MIDLKESILKSLDGTNPELFPYISHLLKDLWSIGSSSDIVIKFIKDHNLNTSLTPLKILDLGCGKGAVSIPAALEFNAFVTGIDAMPDFIDEAKAKAKEMNVENLCSFKVGDIRTVLPSYNGYNLIILGSIGPILGNVGDTLSKLESCLDENGYVILDDGYIPRESNFENADYLKEDKFFKQIECSNFKIVDQYVHSKGDTEEINDEIFKLIEYRA